MNGAIPRQNGSRRWEPVLVFLGLLTLYWMGNGRTSLWDRDEPRYAGTARTMLRTGDYIVPYFNGDFRFTKPVLTYWSIAASYKLLGINEFSARAPSGLAMAAAGVVVYWLGNRHFGRPAGLLASVMLGLSPMAFFLGKLCIPDGMQFLFGTVCFGCLWIICLDAADAGKNPGIGAREVSDAAFGFWLSYSLALLTKGPIVPAMAASAWVSHKFITRTAWRHYRFRWRVGLLLVALAAGPWYATMYYLTGMDFFREAAGNQLFNRVHRAFDKSLWPPGYYAVTVAGGILPWLGLFWLVVRRSRERLLRDPNLIYLATWTFGSMAVVELFRSKQPHYYAPAYPAVFLFVADTLARLLRGEIAWHFDRTARRLIVGGATLAAIGTFVLLWVMARTARSVDGPTTAIAIGLAATLFLAGVAMASNRLRLGLWLNGAAVAGLFAMLSMATLPALSARCVSRAIAEQLTDLNPNGLPVALHRIIEPSLVYYADSALPMYFRKDELREIVDGSPRGILSIMSNGELNDYQLTTGSTPKVIKSFTGMVKMHNDTVFLVHLPAMRRHENDEVAERPNSLR